MVFGICVAQSEKNVVGVVEVWFLRQFMQSAASKTLRVRKKEKKKRGSCGIEKCLYKGIYKILYNKILIGY